MTTEEVITAYSTLPPETQIRVLARFAHGVTVIARETYVPGSESVSDPRRLRHLNEVQHRVLGQLDKMLANDSGRYTDAETVATVAAEGDPRLSTAFSAAIRECGDNPSGNLT